MTSHIRTVQAVIEGTIREQLEGAVIDSVEVHEDVDHDEDPILRVFVIYDDKVSRLDPGKTVGMVRHVRDKLEHEAGGEDRFPIISYISRTDAKRLNAATA